MQEARSRQDEKHTQDSYSRYLISKGQLDEAKWASGLSVSPGAYTVSDPKTVALNLFAPTPNENEIQKPWTLLYQILGVIYIFTLAGVVSAVLMYQGRFKIREAPLASASRWGISLGLLASVTLLFPLLTGFQGDIQDQRSVISLFVLLLCGMLYRMLKDSISGFIRTMLYTIGIFLTYAWSAVFICSSLFVSMYANVNLLVLQSMIRLAASAMIVPLMFGMLIAIWARVRKIPVSRGLVRGTGALALPVLTLLMGSYIGTVFVAAHREAKADIMVKRMILDPVFFNDELVRRSKHGNSM